jgi:hypothetical protein
MTNTMTDENATHDEVESRIRTLETAQATQTATLAGAEATQAAATAGMTATGAALQAGTMATIAAGSVAFVVGIFLGLAVANSRR